MPKKWKRRCKLDWCPRTQENEPRTQIFTNTILKKSLKLQCVNKFYNVNLLLLIKKKKKRLLKVPWFWEKKIWREECYLSWQDFFKKVHGFLFFKKKKKSFGLQEKVPWFFFKDNKFQKTLLVQKVLFFMKEILTW